ncbi:MAG: nucleotidyltransferase family protein, partial [Bacteroidetes bacterium]
MQFYLPEACMFVCSIISPNAQSKRYMKAVIPVAGAGTQLRPHTHTQPKPLIPVAGKPILGHIIDNLIQAGVKDHLFIVGYLKEKIQEYVEQNYAGKIEMEFVVQEPRKGLGHALWMARNQMARAEELLIILGDTIFDEDTQKILELPGNVLAVQEVDNPLKFGIAVVDEDQSVVSLTEKPQIPISNLALVGMYKIEAVKALIEELDQLVKRPLPASGEYALTDALMQMLVKGHAFRAFRVENWFDCGKKQSLLHTNRILLERSKGQTQ